MPNFSIAINFFIPSPIVNNLKFVKTSGNTIFDWTKSKYCHCTVKAITYCDSIPSKEVLDSWVFSVAKTLEDSKGFNVTLKDVDIFPSNPRNPTTVYSRVYSEELVNLHKKLWKVLPKNGSPFENSNFQAHASLFMVKDSPQILSGKNQVFGTFKVKELQLVIWNLKSLNNPKIYKKFKLK